MGVGSDSETPVIKNGTFAIDLRRMDDDRYQKGRKTTTDLLLQLFGGIHWDDAYVESTHLLLIIRNFICFDFYTTIPNGRARLTV